MAPTELVNDVPMQGDGFYSSNSGLQRAAMLEALPLLAAAAAKTKVSSRAFTAIEYGSAHGSNSYHPFSTILESLPTPPEEAHIIFNDRPVNDFVTLSKNLNNMTFPLPATSTLLTSMAPKSFYSAVAPSGSIDIGFSLAALHHLDQVTPVPDGVMPPHEERQAEFRAQAHTDLRVFLGHRAREIVPGGSLVLSFVGDASCGEENYTGPVDACRTALIDMLGAGLLPPNIVSAFEVPTYNRTLGDVRKSLAEVSGQWAVEEVFERRVLHPAVKELRERKERGEEGASEWYADTVADWLMAVVSGYFVKAVVYLGLRDKVDELLEEWVRRTRKVFLEKHRDEEVYCWFVYGRLTRL
ncbi:S-adenosyl-L-methionine-dependent methyltransferase [Aspergillus heteromorphus CBS 117.55]|uniref:S-adenosyl-L-methionine-dependent methyltransferase n=1 Tax=Aspergillus heteromorphus CBS 117.55 TaxID=1448321 RepID=A0A317W348_9EURO|nr:S-adenosyl-L-methionine-dependent methyltransferase [Aspergillus heteromorphus CBS 117.55]PWY79692.1 S-adenosyl-L-methionine-dependent methyltransferase [Aspergillus heteromorphus CBS 117.55]